MKTRHKLGKLCTMKLRHVDERYAIACETERNTRAWTLV